MWADEGARGIATAYAVLEELNSKTRSEDDEDDERQMSG